jgi:hypothetical protein
VREPRSGLDETLRSGDGERKLVYGVEVASGLDAVD